MSWVPHTLGKTAQVQQKVQKGSPWHSMEAYTFHAQNNGQQNKVIQWNINLKLFFSSEGPGVTASTKNVSTFTLCIDTFFSKTCPETDTIKKIKAVVYYQKNTATVNY